MEASCLMIIRQNSQHCTESMRLTATFQCRKFGAGAFVRFLSKIRDENTQRSSRNMFVCTECVSQLAGIRFRYSLFMNLHYVYSLILWPLKYSFFVVIVYTFMGTPYIHTTSTICIVKYGNALTKL